MVNATIKREMKRILKRAAPGLTSRLRAWAAPDVAAPVVVQSEGLDTLRAAIRETQRRFDESHPVTEESVSRIAQNSSLIVVGVAPFPNVAMLVDALVEERIVLRELVIVDATAEEPRLVAIRDHHAAWSRRLPLTRFVVVPYSRQELRFADAVEQGFQIARERYVWVAGRDLVPMDRCFEYLFKALVTSDSRATVLSCTSNPAGKLQSAEVPAGTLDAAAHKKLLRAERFDLLDGRMDDRDGGLSAHPLIEPLRSFRQGIFGGTRALLVGESGQFLDPRFITNIAVADLSLRLGKQSIPMVRTSAAVAWSMRAEPTDAVASWEAIHDWRWLLDRRSGSCVDPARIEIVCPFHRGDVVLATQVATYAASLGIRVRMHVAAPLVSWAKDFAPAIEIEPVPVEVASAEETYPLLLASYRYVSQRADASPRFARCHPTRGLSETGQNLVEYMLEEVGLPVDTVLPNTKPSTTEEHRRVAAEIVRPFGQDIIFLHPLGGWSLKSLPAHILAEFAKRVRDAGFKLIQIGGEDDTPVDFCDGAILRNFMPAQWREILALGRALAGVDSWTSHFGAILDIPQISLYGSTHPKHVNTKRFFVDQSSPCLILGPIVNCSPCNSLTCVAFPERNFCTGYAIDSDALNSFLAALRVPVDPRN
ncbi:hypothetical protein BCh11DRAFT_03592 [Burkholderia sp. Ch1-1]|nr:hypothetical protein BCh11DRAFT_03592 [Burkholderia sp. Ch1-1]